MVDGRQVGQVAHAFTVELERFADTFRITAKAVELADRLDDFAARTEAMAEVLENLKEEGKVYGWRDESYPVKTSFDAPALFDMERAGVPLFGVCGYGVHLNGYVRLGDGVKMWIGRRSLSKPTGPGKLDQVVAGGQPSNVSLRDNLIKECAEEANIPEHMATDAVAVGTVTYVTERPEGLRRDVLFNFDLELPEGFEPANVDGEVDGFYLWPIDEIAERLATSDEFKFNSALVVIDFLVRHGFIDADEPDYEEIVAGLRR